jgi:hypothetical protein
VLRRGTAVAWPNGIVPYQFFPGYGMDIFIQKISFFSEVQFLKTKKIIFRTCTRSIYHSCNGKNGT